MWRSHKKPTNDFSCPLNITTNSLLSLHQVHSSVFLSRKMNLTYNLRLWKLHRRLRSVPQLSYGGQQTVYLPDFVSGEEASASSIFWETISHLICRHTRREQAAAIMGAVLGLCSMASWVSTTRSYIVTESSLCESSLCYWCYKMLRLRRCCHDCAIRQSSRPPGWFTVAQTDNNTRRLVSIQLPFICNLNTRVARVDR